MWFLFYFLQNFLWLYFYILLFSPFGIYFDACYEDRVRNLFEGYIWKKQWTKRGAGLGLAVWCRQTTGRGRGEGLFSFLSSFFFFLSRRMILELQKEDQTWLRGERFPEEARGERNGLNLKECSLGPWGGRQPHQVRRPGLESCLCHTFLPPSGFQFPHWFICLVHASSVSNISGGDGPRDK